MDSNTTNTQGCIVVRERFPANILKPERRYGKYRWPQVER